MMILPGVLVADAMGNGVKREGAERRLYLYGLHLFHNCCIQSEHSKKR